MNIKKWNVQIKRFMFEAKKGGLYTPGVYLLEGNPHKDINLIKHVLKDLVNSKKVSKIAFFSEWGLRLLKSYESGGDPPKIT